MREPGDPWLLQAVSFLPLMMLKLLDFIWLVPAAMRESFSLLGPNVFSFSLCFYIKRRIQITAVDLKS